jgi:hypothetical protein
VQIKAIRRAGRARTWHKSPLVETVDRMQGQECEAVIVSYGVSDIEHRHEREGIHLQSQPVERVPSKGETKTIVFLPRPLIEPPIQGLRGRPALMGLPSCRASSGSPSTEARLFCYPAGGRELKVFRVRI